jgi:3-isopropylmalate/(R)-2-methylmalate dehydratase small subunit
MLISGKAIKLGDNIDTDVILPGKYLVLTNPQELAKHAMEGLDPNFTEKIKEETILIAGKNFGCGSSREQAPLALKHAGIHCVVAESFARIFFRNSINIGLPIVECQNVSKIVEDGDELNVNLKNGHVTNLSKNISLSGIKLPLFILNIISDGGLIKNLRRRMSKE